MRAKSLLLWVLVGLGVALPWVTGIGVKLHLQAHGKPTYPWSSFFHPAAVMLELWATVWFAAPFAALGMIGRYDLLAGVGPLAKLSPRARLWPLALGAAAGAVAAVPAFLEVFRSYDPIVLLVPFFVAGQYVGYMLAGVAVGLGFAGAWRALRRSPRRVS